MKLTLEKKDEISLPRGHQLVSGPSPILALRSPPMMIMLSLLFFISLLLLDIILERVPRSSSASEIENEGGM